MNKDSGSVKDFKAKNADLIKEAAILRSIREADNRFEAKGLHFQPAPQIKRPRVELFYVRL